ncbi:hypothetical protein MFFC18_21240 [Mariniblastus fucicola]|uniref:Uncharacterized protein n=1 Tax=Mariniblastus fucicola TaxID=980251 RepID=A0A5B9P7F4_9BACT|nr:hypothetical protein MFFC18_21240 [Mariniblastus fucicola]
MTLIGIGIPAFLAFAFSFCAHFCSNDFDTGYQRGVVASAIASLPLGVVVSMYLTTIWNCPSIVAAVLSVAFLIAFSIFASFTTGLLFLADYKRLSK